MERLVIYLPGVAQIISAERALISPVNSDADTIEQPFEKIDIVDNHVIVVGTGQVGIGQRFSAIVKNAWNKKLFPGDPLSIGKFLCATAITDFASTHVRPGSYGALVAFPSLGQAHLTEFSISDFQPEMKTEKMWFSSMGSAQYITDTFLAFLREVFWTDGQPNVSGGIFAAKWTLNLRWSRFFDTELSHFKV